MDRSDKPVLYVMAGLSLVFILVSVLFFTPPPAKFGVGNQVKILGQIGTVSEVTPSFGGNFYTVRYRLTNGQFETVRVSEREID